MLNYRLRFEPDDNDTVLVTSPDFPMVTFGADRDAAMRQAGDAAIAILQSMIDARDDIPLAPAVAGGDATLVLPPRVLLKVALYLALRSSGLTRADLQRRLKWQRESVDRLFRLDHESKLDQLTAAFTALDKGVDIAVTDRPVTGRSVPRDAA